MLKHVKKPSNFNGFMVLCLSHHGIPFITIRAQIQHVYGVIFALCFLTLFTPLKYFAQSYIFGFVQGNIREIAVLKSPKNYKGEIKGGANIYSSILLHIFYFSLLDTEHAILWNHHGVFV